MTPTEFRAARLALGLGAPRCAAFLGVALSTVQRWEAPDGPPVPRATALLMAWLAWGQRPELPPDRRERPSV